MRRLADRGSAVADFVMVAGLVSFVFLGLLQLGFVLHARNTLLSCAAEGARLGARVDASPSDGVARTKELITEQLSPRFAQTVTATEEISGGIQVVIVRVDAPLPILGPFGPGRELSVAGRAFSERQ